MWKERTRKTERKERMAEGTERENGRKGESDKQDFYIFRGKPITCEEL